MAITNRKKSVRSGTEATRTTLAIDNDVLLLICQRAAASGTSLGKTVSDLIRQSTVTIDDEPRFYYYGIRLLPKRGNREPITPELVKELQAERTLMRTTLNIDEEVLVYVKQIAERSHRSVGETLSELAREAIQARNPDVDENDEMVIPRRPNEPPVTLEFVNSLRDDYL